MWKTEKDFAKYIMSKMKDVGMIPVRVETPATVNGFPDLYVMGRADDYFIEFKNKPSSSIQGVSDELSVPWRPGQQAFAMQYMASHMKNIHSKWDGHVIYKCTWTFMGMRDGAVFIRMMNYHEGNRVHKYKDPDVFVFTTDDLKLLNIEYFLRTHSQVVVPKSRDTPKFTEDLAVYINRAMKYYMEDVFASASCDIDYPMCEDYLSTLTEHMEDGEYFWDKEYSFDDKKRMYLKVARYVAQEAWGAYHTWLRNTSSAPERF